MEFVDLKLQQDRIRPALQQRLDAVLAHGHYIMGPEIVELEAALSAFCGAPHALTCASGSDALLLPLMAWHVGPGDAVFVPDFTFFATSEMPALLGATPIFVDVERQSRNMNPHALEQAILQVKHEGKLKPRVIISVDLFGQPCDYTAILDIARKHDLLVLEDAAQAFGGQRHGKMACNQGCHASATSFFPAKPLGCYGDGGAVFTADAELAAHMGSLRVHGKGVDKYDNRCIGINGRMDTLQAAVLLSKLEIFADELAARQQVAGWYEQYLPASLERPVIEPGAGSSWAQYTVLVPGPRAQRDTVQRLLKDVQIPTQVYYPTPQHALSVFAYMNPAPEAFPVAQELANHILALPMHPYLTKNDVRQIAEALDNALGTF